MRTRRPRIEPRTAPTTTGVGVPVFGFGAAEIVSCVAAGAGVGLEAGAVEGVRPIVVVYVESLVIERITEFCLS